MDNSKGAWSYKSDGVNATIFLLTSIRAHMFNSTDEAVRPLVDAIVAASAAQGLKAADHPMVLDILTSSIAVTHAAWPHTQRGIGGTIRCNGRELDVSLSFIGPDETKAAHLIDRQSNEEVELEFTIGTAGTKKVTELNKAAKELGIDSELLVGAKKTLKDMDSWEFHKIEQVYRGMVREDRSAPLTNPETALVFLLDDLSNINMQANRENDWAAYFTQRVSELQPLPDNWQDSFIQLTRHVMFDVPLGTSNTEPFAVDMPHPSYDALLKAGFSSEQAREFFVNQALITRPGREGDRITAVQRQALAACFRSAGSDRELTAVFNNALVRRMTRSDDALSERGNLMSERDWAALRVKLSAAKLEQKAADTPTTPRPKSRL